jgi:hypothetical protein
MRSASPLDGRPGLRTEASRTNALAKELGQLCVRHGLIGAVLISFKHDLVGVNSSGTPDAFGIAMERLGDQILAAIDDGQFDPDEAENTARAVSAFPSSDKPEAKG